MEKYSKEQLIQCLQDLDYPNNEALYESVISQLNDMGDEAQLMFDKWYVDRRLPKIDINGITTKFLVDVHKMTPIAMILTYDRLIKEPEQSARLLKKLILKYPFEYEKVHKS